MQHSSDYAVEIKNCDDMTEQLQQYISKHPKSDWSASAQTALMSWKSRKAHIEQQLNSLIMKVANLMEQRVRQEAKKVHPMSNIEKLQIESSNTSAIGGNIKSHINCRCANARRYFWQRYIQVRNYCIW